VFNREKDEAQRNGLQIFEAEDRPGLRTAIASAKTAADALMLCADPSFNTWRKHVVKQVEKHPAIYPFRSYPEAGGLMSSGPNLRKAYRRADRRVGEYVAKVLNGIDVNSLPMEKVPISDFELVINGNTAEKVLGRPLTQAERKGAHVIGEN
jgi:putative ABC transport system substrate-binding protein